MSAGFTVRSLSASVYRCPIDTPVVTSFGTMRDRPMVLVRAEGEEGAVGWGEVWCNFPSVGAEHRARLVASVLAPLVENRRFEAPRQAFEQLDARTAVLALQAGEPGPLAQAIAGVDIALWDLVARKLNQPLWRLLGGTTARIPVYASGLNPDRPQELAARRRDEGYAAFKLKVGFGAARDVANLKALRLALGDATLMVDANQGWTLEHALEMAPQIEEFGIQWLEEPLRADRPWHEWQTLAQATRLPLAAGENICGEEQFDSAIGSRALRVLQPDVAKWGGISGCLPVARKILAAGLRYCPHYLGGGIGLLASAHLLAAAGGDGMLEIDANPNPLRTALCGPLADVNAGACRLTDAPGLGVTPDIDSLGCWAVPG